MKILYLLSQRPDSTGSGFYVQAIMKQAAEAGHTCALVAGVDENDSISVELPPSHCYYVKFNGKDLPFAIPGMSDVMPYESTRFINMNEANIEAYKASFSAIITKAVNDFKPDIIHSNHLWIMSGVARKLFPGIPLLISCHGTDLRQLGNCHHLKQPIINDCRKADIIIALSEIQKNEISETLAIPEGKISVAGIGYNDKRFYYAQKPSPSPVKILFAGKLSEAKGVPWLLQTIAKIRKNPIPFHLYIAGSGTGREFEKCLHLTDNVKEHVTLCGALEQEKLAELMRDCHIFVLPSFFEGLPLVLFEALASGCRVITTALPGTKEILKNVSNDFVKLIQLPKLKTIDSPYHADIPVLIDALAEALINMLTQCTIKSDLCDAAVAKTTQAYTWINVYQRIETEYHSMMKIPPKEIV